MGDKIFNGGEWTAARFNSFIKGGLRQLSYRWGPIHKVKKAAWVERGVYQCKGYKKRTHKVPCTVKNDKGVRKNNVFVDHIDPVVPSSGFKSWDSVISRMFCEADGFQLLCTQCHKEKTKDERDERNKNE